MLRNALELMRPLGSSITAGAKSNAIEQLLHDFYGGSGFMRRSGPVQYLKDDTRLIAALDAVRHPGKDVSGEYPPPNGSNWHAILQSIWCPVQRVPEVSGLLYQIFDLVRYAQCKTLCRV